MPAKFCDFRELIFMSFVKSFSNSAILLILRCSCHWCWLIFPNLSTTKVEKTVKGCLTRRCCYGADVVAIAGTGWLISDSRVCSKENWGVSSALNLKNLGCPANDLFPKKDFLARVQKLGTRVHQVNHYRAQPLYQQSSQGGVCPFR